MSTLHSTVDGKNCGLRVLNWSPVDLTSFACGLNRHVTSDLLEFQIKNYEHY